MSRLQLCAQMGEQECSMDKLAEALPSAPTPFPTGAPHQHAFPAPSGKAWHHSMTRRPKSN
eukprot:328251-Pelagomonas_calceolata.AAC.7